MLKGSIRNVAVATVITTSSMAAATAEPLSVPTTVQILDFCRSATMAEAETKGSALNWQRMSDTDLAGWREGFLASNGGTVDIIGWRRSENDVDGLLSFWIANGESRHRACSYSVGTPDGLLDGLKRELGAPSDVLSHDFGEVVTWTQGAMEVSFSRVGSSAGVVVSNEY